MNKLKTPLIENHDRAYDANRAEVRVHRLVDEYNTLAAENEKMRAALDLCEDYLWDRADGFQNDEKERLAGQAVRSVAVPKKKFA